MVQYWGLLIAHDARETIDFDSERALLGVAEGVRDLLLTEIQSVSSDDLNSGAKSGGLKLR